MQGPRHSYRRPEKAAVAVGGARVNVGDGHVVQIEGNAVRD